MRPCPWTAIVLGRRFRNREEREEEREGAVPPSNHCGREEGEERRGEGR
jgi:hypothetical protein